MFKKSLFVLFSCAAILNSACQSAEPANENAVVITNAKSSANMPPGLSGSPVTLANNSAPGINPNAVNMNASNVSANIPGITDSKTDGKPLPKNTPPIPGIPSEAELKRQMNTPISNSKIMERKPPIVKSNSAAGPTGRPRTIHKP